MGASLPLRYPLTATPFEAEPAQSLTEVCFMEQDGWGCVRGILKRFGHMLMDLCGHSVPARGATGSNNEQASILVSTRAW